MRKPRMAPDDILKILSSPFLINIYGIFITFGRISALMETRIKLWGYFLVSFPLFGIGGAVSLLSETGGIPKSNIISIISYTIAAFGYIWLVFAMYKDHEVLRNSDLAKRC